MAAKLTNWFTK